MFEEVEIGECERVKVWKGVVSVDGLVEDEN